MFDQPELSSEIISTFTYHNQTKLDEHIAKIFKTGTPTSQVSELFSYLADKKVLLAVDQVNALYCPTQYRNPEGATMMPENFIIMKLIKESISNNVDWKIIGSNCNVDPMIRDPTWPSNQLVSNKIELEPFSEEEVKVLLDFYNELGHAYKTSPKYTSLMKFVSGGKPGKLKDACNYDYIYNQ